jgi:thiol-disulfide isomerase/thioredoxin
MLKISALLLLLSLNGFSQKTNNDSIKIKFDYDKTFGGLNYSKDEFFLGKTFPIIDKKDINGKLFDTISKKRLVLYNFWQKNCSPCILETDMLNQLEAKFSNEVDFIAITYETKEDIFKFNKKHPLNFRQIIFSRDSITNLYLYSGYPASFLVFDDEIIEISLGGPTDINSTSFHVSLYNSYSKFRKAIERKILEIKK